MDAGDQGDRTRSQVGPVTTGYEVTNDMRNLYVGLVTIFAALCAPGLVSGQDFPVKVVRIVSTEAGGGNDFVARILAQALTANLGQQVIVDNRGGANGIIAAQTVLKAPPDGYTLLNYSGGLWILPFIQDVPYDPVQDFSPVTLAVSSPSLLVVHASLPVKSVKQLVDLAKSRKGELNYGTGATGSTPHLAAELFKSMAGVDVVRVTYKSSGLALNALISGEVQLAFATAGPVGPHIKSGRLRPLAVTSLQANSLAPGLPTVAATLPGYEASSVFGIFAPAKTPVAIIARLNRELLRVLSSADVKQKFLSEGTETVGNTPAEFAAVIKSDLEKLGKVIRDAGIRAN